LGKPLKELEDQIPLLAGNGVKVRTAKIAREQW